MLPAFPSAVRALPGSPCSQDTTSATPLLTRVTVLFQMVFQALEALRAMSPQMGDEARMSPQMVWIKAQMSSWYL